MSDAALRELERAHEAAPDDLQVARAYLRALEQRGEQGERLHGLWALLLREHYGVTFPEDLFEAWEFFSVLAEERGVSDPRRVLWDLGFVLGGPFDLIVEGLADLEPAELPWVMHFRYYLDPPEFFTVAFGDSDGLHWGYWFDDPDAASKPVVCSYYTNDAYDITECGTTLLEALDEELTWFVQEAEENPDAFAEGDQEAASVVIERLELWHERSPPPQLERNPTLPTVDGMGLVVSGVTPDALMSVDALAELADNLEEAKHLLESAREDLEAGRLLDALQVARALWARHGANPIHTQAAELLASCYEALDRPILAWVTRSQAPHRSIPSVDLLAD